jgi:hypothetical protein
MSNGRSTPFPVIYSDGETETILGILRLYPTSDMNTLLFILSEKIKILPHLFTVFLAKQGSTWKIPFSFKINIAEFDNKHAEYYLYVKSSVKKNKNPSQKFKPLNIAGNLSDEYVERLRRGPIGQGKVGVCGECFMEKITGIDADFHLCIGDKEILGFRTTAGPISRPVRSSGKNGH